MINNKLDVATNIEANGRFSINLPEHAERFQATRFRRIRDTEVLIFPSRLYRGVQLLSRYGRSDLQNLNQPQRGNHRVSRGIILFTRGALHALTTLPRNATCSKLTACTV